MERNAFITQVHVFRLGYAGTSKRALKDTLQMDGQLSPTGLFIFVARPTRVLNVADER